MCACVPTPWFLIQLVCLHVQAYTADKTTSAILALYSSSLICYRCFAFRTKRTFCDKYVDLSTTAAVTHSSETANQSSQLWMFSHRLRMTASNVAKVSEKKTTPGKKPATRMLSPVFPGNTATKHGKQMEAVACAESSKKTCFLVGEVGTVVLNQKLLWLVQMPSLK